MSSVVNKSTATAQNESDFPLKSPVRKWTERVLMFIAMVGTVIAVMLYGDLITRFINPPLAKSIIYGRWVEQDVAPYAREEFTLSEQGVSVRGSIVATDFKFDGSRFAYKAGSHWREFQFVGQDYVEMKLDASAHYLPVFRLEGKNTLSLR
ncbi:DUF2850 domain-containing protein [Vibrio sp. CAU 1672]|uniref:DUF2850 domain-containing protein n=1 Tax=Vibrio sp. CAU 1672 TaxID=3032594 RepID=UPI0023D9A841|nr:DUF2850 domain-containing protein [Vibrio sp. CAU 1672]MDF2154400.1 DUF2850 domain-containing protein [Vibrio sp. CAU 1672]